MSAFRRLALGTLALGTLALRTPVPPTEDTRPLRFAVLGNSGIVTREQRELAEQLARRQETEGFRLLLLTGDNLKGPASPARLREAFEEPYADLLDAGVEFRAVLGNHDDPTERFYQAYNMEGRHYYSFRAPHGSVRFFALESSYLDEKQLRWLDDALAKADEQWLVCVLHHPLYSSRADDGQRLLRRSLEPILERRGVSLVFAGHEYAYERVRARDGIQHFVSGAASRTRRRKPQGVDFRYDEAVSFMLCEVEGERLRFQVVNKDGRVVDEGIVERRARRESEP